MILSRCYYKSSQFQVKWFKYNCNIKRSMLVICTIEHRKKIYGWLLRSTIYLNPLVPCHRSSLGKILNVSVFQGVGFQIPTVFNFFLCQILSLKVVNTDSRVYRSHFFPAFHNFSQGFIQRGPTPIRDFTY